MIYLRAAAEVERAQRRQRAHQFEQGGRAPMLAHAGQRQVRQSLERRRRLELAVRHKASTSICWFELHAQIARAAEPTVGGARKVALLERRAALETQIGERLMKARWTDEREQSGVQIMVWRLYSHVFLQNMVTMILFSFR